MKHVVEVRVPTYKRNLLLRRALSSLQKQTYPNWRAIIFDDSEEGEAEEVYKEFQSERIIYRKNPKNLGVAGNLDQAFLTKAYTQADFAFVLEDDNVLYPEFIQKNIQAIFASGCSIVRCDQEYWVQDGYNYYKTSDSILTPWFETGIYKPVDLWWRMLFTVSISNGGIFWKTDAKSNLQIGPKITDPNLQEGLRCLRIKENVFIHKNSLAKYTFIVRPQGEAWSRLRKIRYTATQMAVCKIISEKVGPEFFEVTYDFALQTNTLPHWEHWAARLGYFRKPFRSMSPLQARKLFLKEVLRSSLFGGIYKELKNVIDEK